MSIKDRLLEQILSRLGEEKETLERAAQATYEGATHEESAAEHRYDTRGLEASYLVGAQSKRAAELEQALHTYQHLALRSFESDSPIALSALIQLMDEEGARRWYFLGPLEGGMKLQGDRAIVVITPSSPMGRELLGARVGDAVEVEQPGGIVEYEILSIE